MKDITAFPFVERPPMPEGFEYSFRDHVKRQEEWRGTSGHPAGESWYDHMTEALIALDHNRFENTATASPCVQCGGLAWTHFPTCHECDRSTVAAVITVNADETISVETRFE